MIFVYILINTTLYLVSKEVYKDKLNPISIYSFVWSVMLITYELKLIYYYDLSLTTWFVIISYQLAFTISCLFGGASLNQNKNVTLINDFNYSPVNNTLDKKLKKVIIFLSAISSIGIIPNFLTIVNNYGFNVFEYTTQIYHDRLKGNRSFELIPYIGTFIHLAVILTGIYINRYGMKKFIIIPLALLILNIIPTGGRSDFILGTLYIVFPILFGKRKSKMSKRQILGLISIVSIIGFVFTKITINRSAWVTPTSYMSPLMIKLVEINPAIYKIYEYLSSPPGVLNAYLKDTIYNFGINSFSFFISILNKLGANLEYRRYQEAYNIPIYTNVGTYIRELIQDFTYLGGIIVIIGFGYLYGRVFSTYKMKRTFISEIYVTLFSVLIFMSFFVWFYRETVFWITTIIGIPIGLYLDYHSKKCK